jgi:PEP-CTERM motif-containing protein
LSSTGGIAMSGSDLFVTNVPIGGIGTIGEYTTAGATVNAALISGLPGPVGIAVDGSDLFVAKLLPLGSGSIGEYTTAGATVNARLISGLGVAFPAGIAIASGPSAIPEPSTWAMMLLGFAGVGFAAYRRRSPKNGSWLAAA